MALKDTTAAIQTMCGVAPDGVYGVATADAIFAKLSGFGDSVPVVATRDEITERTLTEILEHEGIVLEAYRDSVGVWTWGVGVTAASGHDIDRYKDKPSTLERAIQIYEWLLRVKYVPAVFDAFGDHKLLEHQLAAALSFHWNTGAIGRATWVKAFLAGNIEEAKREFMNWSSPKEIIGRRKAERDLFFDGHWTGDGMVTLYQRVRKPSYTPDWGSAKQIDIRPVVAAVLAEPH